MNQNKLLSKRIKYQRIQAEKPSSHFVVALILNAALIQ